MYITSRDLPGWSTAFAQGLPPLNSLTDNRLEDNALRCLPILGGRVL